MKNIAFITGITGQDGSYLAELLLQKGYIVHGLRRRASNFNTSRLDHLLRDDSIFNKKLFLHYGDLTDANSLSAILTKVRPTEIYNLAAQSHVGLSFQQPVYTFDVDAVGTLRLLESVRVSNLFSDTKFYQASTSELFGAVLQSPQDEMTPFNPVSPYAIAKHSSFMLVKAYRQAYGLFGVNGILFNHESPRRGETFVTRKITMALARISRSLQDCLYLGNLDALRDWGHAKDFVSAMWLMLNHHEPLDLVISTGEQHSVREFVCLAAERLGMELRWEGKGIEEFAVWQNCPISHGGPKVVVRIDPAYYRPNEVNTLLGDPAKAVNILNWRRTYSFTDLVFEMVDEDISLAEMQIANE